MQRRHAIACIPALLLRPAAALNLTEADANAAANPIATLSIAVTDAHSANAPLPLDVPVPT